MGRLKNRQSFLAALGTGAALASLGARVDAQPVAPATGSPSPAESATPKPPSAAAVAVAAGFRRFDPQLTDAEIAELSRDLDQIAGAGAALNPKKKPLRNSDEPVTRFSASAK